MVWLQMLQLAVGSTSVSMAVLLGTFMGGMCIGSLALPKALPAHWPPLKVYAALEIATGLCGLAAISGLPLAGLEWRGFWCTLLLLPPTIMMGATLPVISRYIEASSLGLFYGANIAGGVLGCLLAGFWLLPRFDMNVAGMVAAGINIAVGLIALRLRQPLPAEQNTTKATSLSAGTCFAIALSGFTALGAEVIWTRLLALTLGPTVYTFSIILAIFLTGLGIGSAAASAFVRKDARTCLSLCQALLIPACAWASWMIVRQLPWWDHGNLPGCALALLPAAILWGASFPFAVRATHGALGEVYAANTAGGIAGAVLFSLVLIPQLDSQTAERLLATAAALAALAALPHRTRIAIPLLGTACLGIWATPAIPWQLIAFGRRISREVGPWKNLYTAEGINSSIAYSEWIDKRRFFHVAGKIEASSTPADMRLQRMLGHIPALVHARPRSVLIVGCGAGVTAGAFVVHPEIERITLCEIEPLIPPATARFFARENHGVIKDHRTHIALDDARHYILTTPEKFDIITSDPIHPWVKGAATLYSKEYFELVRAHLKPGGFVTQWVPLYDSDFPTVKSEIATFFDVFPNAAIFGNVDDFGQGYDVVMLGSAAPFTLDVDAMRTRLSAAPLLADSLSEVGFHSAAELLGTWISGPAELHAWLRDAEINRDRSLRLQYLAGRALSQEIAGKIYDQMCIRSPFPYPLFRGSPQSIAAVRKAFDEGRVNPF